MFLLDTNVISELRRPRPYGAVLSWIERIPDGDLHLSAVTIGEIQAGIEITREQYPAKAAEIEAWLDKVGATYNVLPVDARIYRHWAKLMHHRAESLTEDALIAATAHIHGLTVVTRNMTDFADFNVQTLNPFQPRPI